MIESVSLIALLSRCSDGLILLFGKADFYSLCIIGTLTSSTTYHFPFDSFDTDRF